MSRRDVIEAQDRELDLVQQVFSGDNEWCVDDAYRRYLDMGGQLEESDFVDKIRDWYFKAYEHAT